MRDPETIKLTVLAVMCATIFFLALTIIEAIPEIPVDIDFKPFFIPLAFIALLPWGKPTIAIAIGATLGEALRDLIEGYEIDDPIGAAGFVVSFTLAGYLLGEHERTPERLTLAAVISGGVQAVIEGSSYLFFGETGVKVALWSMAGNTITHGVIMGAIPLYYVHRELHGRIERNFGYAVQ